MLARDCGPLPLVLSIHGGRFLSEPIENGFVARFAERMLDRARFILVLSEIERELLSSRFPAVREKIRILPNAVQVSSSPPLPREDSIPRILFAGRLHESKGLAVLVEAVERLLSEGRRFRLDAFGDGPLKDWFIEEMSRLLGERFRYGGVIRAEEARREMRSSDIFVLPSIYGEGLPMAMLEAMSEGCVCVVSEMASVGSVISNGLNGFTVEPGNVESLAEALARVLDNPSEWNELGVAAWRTVLEKHSLERYLDSLDAVYKEAALR
jgi:glycosyltransferase involved in cell wall biosynthesis